MKFFLLLIAIHKTSETTRLQSVKGKTEKRKKKARFSPSPSSSPSKFNHRTGIELSVLSMTGFARDTNRATAPPTMATKPATVATPARSESASDGGASGSKRSSSFLSARATRRSRAADESSDGNRRKSDEFSGAEVAARRAFRVDGGRESRTAPARAEARVVARAARMSSERTSRRSRAKKSTREKMTEKLDNNALVRSRTKKIAVSDSLTLSLVSENGT